MAPSIKMPDYGLQWELSPFCLSMPVPVAEGFLRLLKKIIAVLLWNRILDQVRVALAESSLKLHTDKCSPNLSFLKLSWNKPLSSVKCNHRAHVSVPSSSFIPFSPNNPWFLLVIFVLISFAIFGVSLQFL